MKKAFVVVLLVVLVVTGVAGYLVLGKKPIVNSPSENIERNTSSAGENLLPVDGQYQISIQDLSFSPALIEIQAGSTIVWTNKDGMEHTVSSDTFQSQKLGQGQTFSQIFNEVGEFNYFCSIHPNMKGKIIVK